jgi:aerobic carbon-monoxide dehydrogenase large subunit
MHDHADAVADPFAGIGQPARRKEDDRLIVGRGRFAADWTAPGLSHAVFVRSPHAHARIRAIDAARARAMPGVLAVLGPDELAADGLRPIPHTAAPPGPPDSPLRMRAGTKPFITTHALLPADTVRYAGEAVVMVVAETLEAAHAAAEAVAISYDALPAIASPYAALADSAPRLWEEASSNVMVDAELGDAAATQAAFDRAAHVVRLDTWVQRVTAAPMEPRAAMAQYDAGAGRYTLYAASGNVVRQRREVAACLAVPEDQVRVIAGDIGGNFGMRNPFYPEFALVAWASRRCGGPVKWVSERHEAFLSDYQGRGLAIRTELALASDGNFLALRSKHLSDFGAQTVTVVPLAKSAELATGVYRLDAAHVEARAVVTNAVPTSSYRSSGRPETMFAIERLIDIAARRTGVDRVELRRRNLIGAGEASRANPLGLAYDNCDFVSAMNAALALADWDGFPERRAEAKRHGRLRGIGLANYIEIASGFPHERAELLVRPEGRVECIIGTLASGQGHETSFAQLLTEWLGIPLDRVDLIYGDTEKVQVGGGSHAGRSMRLASVVIGLAADEIVARAKAISAHLLGAPDADVEFANGQFRLPGRSASVSLFDVAAAAECGEGVPDNLRGSLSAVGDQTATHGGFPYGAQTCEVEVDPETGAVEIVRYAAVDDVGRAINPLIIHGQTHGGIAQGVGQALLEHCALEAESGQPLAASFMDYAMPRATLFPPFDAEIMEIPAPTNPLGIRAGGEGGTTPALAVVVNAIVDALAECGVEHLEMPVTPERVWRAMRAAPRQGA